MHGSGIIIFHISTDENWLENFHWGKQGFKTNLLVIWTVCLELGLPLKLVILMLTWQRYGGEAGCERLPQGLQVLVEEPVASPLLHHVAFQPLYRTAHALHMFLQRCVALLILHVGLTQLPHLSFTRFLKNTQAHRETETMVLRGEVRRDDTAKYSSWRHH